MVELMNFEGSSVQKFTQLKECLAEKGHLDVNVFFTECIPVLPQRLTHTENHFVSAAFKP